MIKILIADDEPNILLLTEMLFQDMGLHVITAVDGAEAVQKAIEEKPDIIITDVIMPKMTGFEVCKAIRNIPDLAQTPIIILTALGDEYNKIRGLDGGADDYIIKPFSVEDLKTRARALLLRYSSKYTDQTETIPIEHKPEKFIEYIATGIPALDHSLSGGIPRGSNILILGNLGKGKSSFSRDFVSNGLKKGERSLFIALDDNPQKIRQQLSLKLPSPIQSYEELGLIRFVDAYSWSSFHQPEDEKFAITGKLELSQLAGAILDAGQELGQTVQSKMGGRRVIDSISSLLIHFELPDVQNFINRIARTAVMFGGVTTLFVMEEGTVSKHVLNNIKYVMDGIIEFSEIDGKKAVRVASMKWTTYTNHWTPYE